MQSHDYDLEIDKVIGEIRSSKAKTVLLQLPDGLKPDAKRIQDAIRKKTSADVMIWLGSCFGSCDIPTEARTLGVDLLIAWGHPAWRFE